MKKPKNFVEFYKNNGIYKDERGFYAFITDFSKRYDTKKAIRAAISQCVKNGWELRSMKEVTQMIKGATNAVQLCGQVKKNAVK